MNAPTYINNAHKALSRNPGGLTLEELSGKLRVKALKVSQQIRELHDAGLIETTEDAGQPVYRLIAAPAAESAESGRDDNSLPTKTYSPAVLQAMIADLSSDSEGGETDAPAWATDPALQYLAPEDYEMPPADPALLASANRMLCNRLEAVAEAIRASTIPSLEGIAGAEDLAPHVKTLCDALAAAESTTTARGHTINQLRLEVADLRERLDAVTQQSIADTVAMTEKNTRLAADLKDMTRDRDLLKAENLALKTSEDATTGFSTELQALRTSRANAINEADRLRAELATERQAREALQEQSDAVDVKDSAVGYLVRVPKRAPILRRKPESARDAALSAVRAGAKRADVLAVVPLGTARRGAEWQSTEAGG